MKPVLFSAFLIFSLSFASSCASKRERSGKITPQSGNYYLKDRTGEFLVSRSAVRKGSKLAVKREVYATGQLEKPLEKTVVVSDIGRIKTPAGPMKSLRPSAAQHVIWYDKERFFSQLKLNPRSKSLDVTMKSPEKKWNGRKSFPFPKGSIFCFFSQIPECAKAHGLLEEVEKPRVVQVIWDSYPYHGEMYENVSQGPFEKGVWAFDKTTKDGARYGLVLGGQLVLYEFDADKNFKNMFWVAQGISLTRDKE